MANPTSNFGWQMPTATDLVTDLPADFEVFGQAVDTDFVDLLGGTTGQILSKTSATDLDFTWINNDQGDITGVTAGTGITVTSPTGPVPTVAIDTTVTVDKTTAQTLTNKTLTSPALTTPTISTATTNGDLLYGTGSGALARLGIGTTGQVLNVSGGIPAWATPSSGSMTLLSTTALSGSSVSLTGISQSYKDLRLEIKDITFSSNNAEVLVRFNSDTGSNYSNVQQGVQQSVGVYSGGGVNETSFNVTRNYGMQNTSVDAAFQYYFYDYTNTAAIRLSNAYGSYSKGATTAGDRLLTTQFGSYTNVGTAITTIQVTMSAGTFSTGTVYLYGVN